MVQIEKKKSRRKRLSFNKLEKGVIMIYEEQVRSHVEFLRSCGLDVQILEFGQFVRCCSIEEVSKSKYVYICNAYKMNNKNFLGLSTWCRGKSGTESSFKTYGQNSNNLEIITAPFHKPKTIHNLTETHEIAARRAYGFWKNSSLFGSSDYLTQKGVGAHGIRFRSSEEYGNIAVVPMRDIKGKLWSYQLLNTDGTKRFPKGAKISGLFHALNPLTNGSLIGIAESYVTAATCLELTGISTVCAFSCENLLEVTKTIKSLFPESRLILFADNDRHLEKNGSLNKGISKASEALKSIYNFGCIVSPDFEELVPSKEASDWNDLVRVKGLDFSMRQIKEKINKKLESEIFFL